MEAADHHQHRARLHLVQCRELPPGLSPEASRRIQLPLLARLAPPLFLVTIRELSSWRRPRDLAVVAFSLLIGQSIRYAAGPPSGGPLSFARGRCGKQSGTSAASSSVAAPPRRSAGRDSGRG